jgi:hypothetical protein
MAAAMVTAGQRTEMQQHLPQMNADPTLRRDLL